MTNDYHEFILAEPNFGYERARYRSGNLSLATSPRWDMSSVSVISPGSLCGHNINCNFQDEVKSNNYLRPGMCKIDFVEIDIEPYLLCLIYSPLIPIDIFS